MATRKHTPASLRALLKKHNWNMTVAAHATGVSVQQLSLAVERAGVRREVARNRERTRLLGADGKRRILAALKTCPTRILAADKLQIPRRTLYNLIARHGIENNP